MDEPEPTVDPGALVEVQTALEPLAFPATGSDVVAAVGDREIESIDGSAAVAELIPDTDHETFESPAEVREHVQRPTVAAAMKRILEASERLPEPLRRGSRRDAYERTLLELKGISPDDDDEGIREITDWILGQIEEKGTLPGSRAVRRQAAKICRANGYRIRNDEWLGV